MLMLATCFLSLNSAHAGQQFHMLFKRNFACINLTKITLIFRALKAKKICTDLNIHAKACAFRFCAGFGSIQPMKNCLESPIS